MLFSSILSLSLVTPFALAATAADWRSRSIYQVVTDRFAKGKGEDDTTCDSSQRKYCGGTWQGITDNLDYIQQLGFDAVWISPVVANLEGETDYGEAYLGRWTQNISHVNEHFGSGDSLKELSAALHKRDMYLMVELVVNNFALLPQNQTEDGSYDYSSLAPFNYADAFHPECPIKDYSNQTEVEECWLGNSKKLIMPDLDTGNSSNFRIMKDWAKDLIAQFDVDGFMLSGAKHVSPAFWTDFVGATGIFAMGDVLTDNVTYAVDYSKALPGILDYPTWFPLIDAFSSSDGNFTAVVNSIEHSKELYGVGLYTSGSFIENPDQRRFPNVTTDESLILNAMTWPFVHNGIPIAYYGQEHGLYGGASPENHESLWSIGHNTYHAQYAQHFATLNGVRHLAIDSGKNFLTAPMEFVPQVDKNALAVSRPPLLGLLTNAGSNSSAQWTIPADTGLFQKGESLVDVLTCNYFEVDQTSGDLAIQSDSGMPIVIIPSKLLDVEGKFCSALPTLHTAVTNNSPVSVRNVNTLSSIFASILALALI
ncbi:glycoside hydrolase family 13 protein [Cylindrobasidium torrendii FP15055 ss-10]|uniref:alpha-amylase n=1 Tax=Cylindrobasidium torrendii FP15055 ss-10 TaxID=1314674 RepID=A0A0D7B176_9AGAR|nr:glycoside hydrolase family 13 protein [Cylindrobasidium torrendii FP15055 ss-10]